MWRHNTKSPRHSNTSLRAQRAQYEYRGPSWRRETDFECFPFRHGEIRNNFTFEVMRHTWALEIHFMSGADSEGSTGTRDRMHHRTCCARGSSTASAAISCEYCRTRSIYSPILLFLESLGDDSKRYKMRLTHQVCGQHRRYWPVISSRIMCGPVPRRGTAWFPRKWSSGAVDVVIIVRS